VDAVAATKKPPGSGGHMWIDLSSHHMTKGRRFVVFGTLVGPARAHVQNSAGAVSVAVLRITINGAPLFGSVIMPESEAHRQGNLEICPFHSPTGAT
jgi:hypothetical protein